MAPGSFYTQSRKFNEFRALKDVYSKFLVRLFIMHYAIKFLAPTGAQVVLMYVPLSIFPSVCQSQTCLEQSTRPGIQLCQAQGQVICP